MLRFGYLYSFQHHQQSLVTYILPVFLPLAIIAANVWYDYINKNMYEKSINISVKIFGWVTLIAGIVAIFTPMFLPEQLNSDISSVKWLLIVILIIFGLSSLLLTKQNKKFGIFMSYVLFIAMISAFATGKIFEIDYKFGQQDLIEFAKYAQKHDYTISSYNMGRKYSLIYYNDKIADYNNEIELNPENVKKDLEKDRNIVIIKNKEINEIEGKIDYRVLKVGRRYTMIKNK